VKIQGFHKKTVLAQRILRLIVQGQNTRSLEMTVIIASIAEYRQVTTCPLVNVKIKRGQCDESRLQCSQYVDRAAQCDFADLPTSSQGSLSNATTETNSRLISRTQAREDINLCPEKKRGIPCLQLKYPTKPPCANLELLDHFVEVAAP
jgi:hypothetical protein